MQFFEVIRLHWGIILSVATFVAFVVRLTMDSKYIRKEELHSLKSTVNNIDNRLESVEGEMKHLPTAKDLSDITLLLTKTDGKIDTIAAEMKGLSHQVRLLIEKEVKNAK